MSEEAKEMDADGRQLNDPLSRIGLYLAIEEVARMLGISVEVARALVKAGLPALKDTSVNRPNFPWRY